MMSTGDTDHLWGKSRGLDTPYPLLAHLLDTAAAARVVVEKVVPAGLAQNLADQMGASPQDWKQFAVVLAGWHDFGKASCRFQNFDSSACPPWLAGSVDAADAGRHDRIGACLAWDRLDGHRARYRAAQIISGHHGTIYHLNRHHLSAWGGAGLVDADPPQQLIESRQKLWEQLDQCLGELPDANLPTPAASMVLATVVLADWIASSSWVLEEQQKAIAAAGGRVDPQTHFASAQRLAAVHLREAGLLLAPGRRRRATPERMFAAATGATWTALQESIDNVFCPSGPGIAVICAPTGEGKTEAALLAASKFAEASGRHGLFFAMPTVATAEGLYDRLSECIRRTSPDGSEPHLRRVHSQAVLFDSDTSVVVSEDVAATRAAAQWMSGTRKAMLAPFGVGTVDQVLLGALKAKHSPLRMFAAATGTLIVDEVHALDPYMRILLRRAVEWLAAVGTSVVVLSATMPRKRVSELVAAYQAGIRHAGGAPADADDDAPADGYPMWTAWTPADQRSGASVEPRRRWTLRFDVQDVASDKLTENIAGAAVGAAGKGQCVLVVRSTVRAAQETYEAVRELDPSLDPGGTVEIIHSRMTHKQRRDRCERLLATLGADPRRRPHKMVLVATQVVEQSLDVDFDVLVTDPAPVSALLQRAGRVRRHRPPQLGDPVRVLVVWPTAADGEPLKSSTIYSKADLMGARACLTQANTDHSLTVEVPSGVPRLVERADAESDEQFDFNDSDIEEAEDATLAQIARIDADMSQGMKWAIPQPIPDGPLAELTGHFDSDEGHPGTRHRARSVLVVPVTSAGGAGKTLLDGTPVDIDPRQLPARGIVKAVFDAAIPVSYPNSRWADKLHRLSGAWDRTPVAAALLVDLSTSSAVTAGGYSLRVSDETGLTIRRLA